MSQAGTLHTASAHSYAHDYTQLQTQLRTTTHNYSEEPDELLLDPGAGDLLGQVARLLGARSAGRLVLWGRVGRKAAWPAASAREAAAAAGAARARFDFVWVMMGLGIRRWHQHCLCLECQVSSKHTLTKPP